MANYFISKIDNPDSFIGNNTHWSGYLFFDTSLIIEGDFVGDVFTHGYFEIGSNSSVEGRIFARNLVISGKFKGELVVYERLEIKECAQVEGKARFGDLKIDDGALFNCFCKPMNRDILFAEFSEEQKKLMEKIQGKQLITMQTTKSSVATSKEVENKSPMPIKQNKNQSPINLSEKPGNNIAQEKNISKKSKNMGQKQ